MDAISLEERFRTVLPMLTRQIEALNLLQKSRKLGPDMVPTGRKGGGPPRRRFGPDGNDEDEDGDDTAVLERKVHAANMPEAALKVCLKELKRCGFGAPRVTDPRRNLSLTFSSPGCRRCRRPCPSTP